MKKKKKNRDFDNPSVNSKGVGGGGGGVACKKNVLVASTEVLFHFLPTSKHARHSRNSRTFNVHSKRS